MAKTSTRPAPAAPSPTLSEDILESLSRVICVANGKGGVGKTSLSVHLAGLCAANGQRTLLIEMDPQGNAGQCLIEGWGTDEPEMEGDDGLAMFKSIALGEPLVPPLMNVRENLDFIPGGKHLTNLVSILLGKPMEEGASLLAQALAPLALDYSFIIIDTPPTQPGLIRMAIAASKWLVIPTKSDLMSISGMHTLMRDVMEARVVNPEVMVLGVALMSVGSRSTVVQRSARSAIEEVLGGTQIPVFQSMIRHAEASANMVPERGRLSFEIDEEGEPVSRFEFLREGRTPEGLKPGSMGNMADDYFHLIEEIMLTIEHRENPDMILEGPLTGVVVGEDPIIDVDIEQAVKVASR